MKFSQPGLDPRVQRDLALVYATVGLIFFSVGQGAMFYYMTGGGLIPTIAEIVLLFLFSKALLNTEATEKTQHDRLAYLVGNAFLIGSIMSALLDFTWRAECVEVCFAYTSFALVFASFSVSFLLFSHKWCIYIGGTLCSFVSFNLLLLAVDLLFSSNTLFDPSLCTFLLVFAGLIAFGSSKIISESQRTSADYVTQASRVFVVLSDIRTALFLLTETAQQKLKSLFANRSKKKVK